MPAQPSALALSPDGRYLVVGHYAVDPLPADISIINLDYSTVSQPLTLGQGARVLAVAFGNSPRALVIATNGVRLLDPANRTFSPLTLTGFSSTMLPVPWATFPPTIIRGYASASGDGNKIYAVVNTGDAPFTVLRYDISNGQLQLTGTAAGPMHGPRAISVDQTGDTFLAGSTLLTARYGARLVNLADFPSGGSIPIGGHAFDPRRNVFYAQVDSSGGPILHVVDPDNLTVRERLKLKENLLGKALVSGDTMYAISDSGLTVMPLGASTRAHRVTAMQEDLMFSTSGCDQGAITQFLDIVDPNGGATDFNLTVNSPGVWISPASGTTPMRVQVFVEPSAFQDQKGTSAVSVQINSAQAVNIPMPVRLLVNMRDPDQIGAITNVPGSLVDVLADPSRDRFYVLRQDKNAVLVFDSSNFTQIATLRTGNTPVQMALYRELRPGATVPEYPALMVTNDHSQLISVFDLATLQPNYPIVLPTGSYAHSIVTSNRRIMAVGPGALMLVDFWSRTATYAPQSVLGIYINRVDARNGLTASPSGRRVFMPFPDGTVALYDSDLDTFLTSRQDVPALSGAFAALSDELFAAGSHAYNVALVPSGRIDMLGGVSSGSVMADDMGLLTVMPAAAKTDWIQRYSMDQFDIKTPVRMAEAPLIAESFTPPMSQVGQMILPFTRTLALLRGDESMIQLSTSGFTVLPRRFDAGFSPVNNGTVNTADQGLGLAPGVQCAGYDLR